MHVSSRWRGGGGDNFELNLMLICFKIVEQLEYGLDNANPGYGFNELNGNEDDTESWYNSSTTDSRLRHQLPLLDGSPSLRKNRFFGFQVQLRSHETAAGPVYKAK